MDQASSTLLRLNLETRRFHTAADERWIALTRSEVTRADYMRRLVAAYAFEAPLEAALAYTPNLKLIVDARPRSKAGLLARDLLALGLTAHEVAFLPQRPIAPFATPIEALGWMYVNERATLLHDRVRQHLVARLSDLHDACAYLSAYEGVTNARWNELGHVLDHAVQAPEQFDELVRAAHAAFEAAIESQRVGG